MAWLSNRRLNRVKAVAWALDRIQDPRWKDKTDWLNDCQMFTRMALGNGGGAANAISAWRMVRTADRVKVTASTPPPLGVPVYWSGGHDGHAALSAGEGYVISTDIKRKGKADLVPIGLIAERWKGYKLLGWAKTINGERIYGSETK